MPTHQPVRAHAGSLVRPQRPTTAGDDVAFFLLGVVDMEQRSSPVRRTRSLEFKPDLPVARHASKGKVFAGVPVMKGERSGVVDHLWSYPIADSKGALIGHHGRKESCDPPIVWSSLR